MIDLTASKAHLDSLRNEFGLYYAADSDSYKHVWLRDTIYILLGQEAAGDEQAVRDGIHALYDRILLPYSFKIDWRVVEGPAPRGRKSEYLHPRYMPDGSESSEVWGWTQHDSVGILLWGIIRFEQNIGQILRNDHTDRHLLQKLVWYLQSVDVPDLPDNGVWEESRTIHLSTLASVYAGLEAADKAGFIVDRQYLARLRGTITGLLPRESLEHRSDLAMLTAVWPFGPFLPFGDDIKQEMTDRVASELEGSRGVIRYPGDGYPQIHTCHPGTVEWPLGFALLGLAYADLGDSSKAADYLRKLESAALPDGQLPESWCQEPSCQTHYNSPLGWTQALHLVLAKRLA